MRIIIDSREQQPYQFTRYPDVTVEVATLIHAPFHAPESTETARGEDTDPMKT